MKREWETRNVRACNLKPGDVIEFLNRRTFRAVRRTVDSTEPETIDDVAHVVVRFRRIKTWGLVLKASKLIRIRRLEARRR